MKINRHNIDVVMIIVLVGVLPMIGGCGKPEPASVRISPEQAELTVGESIAFDAAILSDENEGIPDATVTWRVEGDAGTIDETGTFTAKNPGTAVVTARSGNLSAKTEITVEPRKIAQIVVQPEKDKALSGSRISVAVKGLAGDGAPSAHNTISASSPTAGVSLSAQTLSLDASGGATIEVVLPEKPGAVNVVFKGDAATRTLDLLATEITRIAVEPGSGPYTAGRTIDFAAVGYDDYGNHKPVEASWTLAGKTATLTEDGKVKMNQPGKGIILAAYRDVTEGRPFDIVPGEPAEIELTPEAVTLKAGQSKVFSAKAFNPYGYPLSVDMAWNVSGGIGSITANGFFLARRTGSGSVTAAAGDVRAEAAVSVEHGPLAKLSVTLPKTTITAGETVALSAEGTDAYGNRFPVQPRWFLSKSIGSIEPKENTFTARYAGTGEIRALVDNVMDARQIEVVPAELVRLKMLPSTVDVIAGESVQFTVEGYDEYGNRVPVDPAFSIEEKLGDLNGSGKFLAQKAGSTTVASTFKGLDSKATVTVRPAVMQNAALEPSGPVELMAGKRRQFNAYGYDAFGNIVKSEIDWKVFPDIGNMASGGGFYPEKTGKGTLTAEVRQVRTGKTLSVRTDIRIAPGPTARIELKPAEAALTAGETRNFNAAAYDELGNETDADIDWSLTEADLGVVAETGLFRARKTGRGDIKAVVNGIFALAEIKVVPAEIVFLKIVPETVRLHAGEQIELNAVGEDRYGNFTKPVATWRLSDPELGSVSHESVLSARKEGTGWILATAENLVDKIALQVDSGSLARISVSPGEVSVKAGERVDFSAEGFDAGGNPLKITPRWSVQPDLGGIGEKGGFKAETAGTGRVVASVGERSQSVPVRVVPAEPAQISVKPGSVDLAAGESVAISVEVTDAFENRIEDPSYRLTVTGGLGSIDSGDMFTAEKKGSGSIRAAAGRAAAEIPVTVRVGPLHTIDLSPASAEMHAGERMVFSAKGYDAFGNRVDIGTHWAVSGGLGEFPEEGTFKALRPGEGFLSVQAGGISAVSRLVVHPGPVDRIEVVPGRAHLEAGRSLDFKAVAYDAQGNETPTQVNWSLEKKEMGAIDKGGKFTARKARTGIVFARSGEVAGNAEVRVAPGLVTRLSVKPDAIDLEAGNRQKLDVTGMDAFDNPQPVEYEFSVDPEKIGRIDGNVFMGGKAGTGRIIVRGGGVETEIPVKVRTGALADIDIRKADGDMRAGKSYRFHAVGYDESGNQIPLEVKWAATPHIGRIETDTGVFHAGKVGDGMIAAYSKGIAAYRNITVNAGDLYSLFIHPNPVTVTADDTREFVLEGVDIADNPVAVSSSAAEWSVVGDIGKFGSAGVFEASKAGKGKVIAAVSDLIAEAYVTVRPGGPDADNSRVRQTHSVLPADGKSYSDIIIEARDANNNPVPGVDMRVVSSRRADTVVQPTETGPGGVTRARIKSAEPGTSRVSVVVSGRAFEDTAEITFQ